MSGKWRSSKRLPFRGIEDCDIDGGGFGEGNKGMDPPVTRIPREFSDSQIRVRRWRRAAEPRTPPDLHVL